jgi:hypothetical protein
MFQLDDNFLAELGLGELPEEQKKEFLQHTYNTLELRVGTKLSDGLSDVQLGQFEAIIDRREDVLTSWLSDNDPEYATQPNFHSLSQALGINDPNNVHLKAEYAATKWLEINRPDFRDVVSATIEEIKQEILANKDAILGVA